MKYFLPLATVLIVLSAFQCKKNNDPNSGRQYKARLEIKGICYNYTFTLIEWNTNPELMEATWTNPENKRVHTCAFGVANPCSFPATIREGDEFYFTLVNDNVNCAACGAYYPSPSKKLKIKVNR